MLSSLARFTVALALTSSVLGAAIPVARVPTDTTNTTATTSDLNPSVHPGALWKNNVHDKISEAPGTIAGVSSGRLAPSRRSGNLWKGREHEEVARDGLASSDITDTPSGALWKNNVHDKISEASGTIAGGDLLNTSSRDPLLTVSSGRLAPSRRSGNLWKGREHEEVARDGLAPSRRSGELWEGIEHQEVARDGEAPSRRSGELWRGLEHEEVEVAQDGGAPSRRSGELWRGLEHEEVSASPDA
ncbi:hypothetical protein BDR07DRAFT_1376386 [Suillus spraguei]|nr:hypothetical protein BDR07DRAFT_1376386 [Suillus spraguei]